MNKGMMWVMILVALFVGAFAGYYVEKNKMNSQMSMMQSDYQKQLDAAKMNTSNKTTMMKSDNNAMMKNNIIMMTKNATLGSIVTDAKGMSLYTFDNDKTGKSNCNGNCATIWPPYTVSGTVPTKLPEYVTTIKRDDGSMQYAWYDKPLYYYSKDTSVGDTTGDGIGGIWHIAK